jgi:transposase
MERVRTGLKTPGLLFVGDCKMSAWETRAYLARHQDFYLSPLPLTGATAEAMEAWITVGVTQGEMGELERIMRTNDRGHKVLAAEGYEFERTCEALGDAGDATPWRERVLVMRSPMHADQQAAGLEKRLCHAESKLAALTPPRGRGKRQITDEATLLEAIALVLQEQRVDGLLSVAWEKQVEQTTHYVGRGRGALHREKRVIEKIRYHITQIARQEGRIADLRQRFGWKAFVTNAGHRRLSLREAVLCYRKYLGKSNLVF